MTRKYFVLSGGGSRGFAHLGVVKALREHHIEPLEISATSAGAMAGALLANGFSPEEILEMVKGTSRYGLFAWNGFKMGLISMKYIREFFRKNLRYKTFEELPIPLYITATNFEDGSQTIFNKGDIIDAVIASSSIPVVFPPSFINGIPYIDGGISNNLPVEPFADKKEDVVCVYVNSVNPFKPNDSSVMAIMDRAIHLSFIKRVNESAAGCYLFIQPPELSKFGLFDINRFPEIYNIGYNYTKELLKHDKRLAHQNPFINSQNS